MKRIYLDHAATTPLCAEAAAAMHPFVGGLTGNPSSLHREGREARAAVDLARERCASAMGCLFGEFLFTGSGTESCAMAIVGAALAATPGRKKVLVGAAEHHCVLHTQPILEKLGMRVEHIPVDSQARVDLNWLEENLDDSVALVSVMEANNELGSLNPISEVIRLSRDWGALTHVDAVQTFPGLGPVAREADLVSVSAHKLYGPKGVGGLRIKSGVKIQPLIAGGGQEREMRAGTENVAAIAGFGAACEAVLAHPEWAAAKQEARTAFEAEAGSAIEGIVWSVPEGERLGGHSHLRIPGLAAESILIQLDRRGVSASSGAACSSGSLEPSHVLMACGLTEQEAGEGLRFTFGKDSTVAMAKKAAGILAEAVAEIRSVQSQRGQNPPR